MEETQANEYGLKPAQEKIIEYIYEVCIKHSIKYFAIGGTAIEAVRHQKFIPWDDDLDIFMPNTPQALTYVKHIKSCRVE